MRNPLTRTIEILGGTVKDIGKDYTENLQNLITDASTIKSTVIQGANSAKDTFERMRNGSGPIKGLLNWFYTKETETDPFDLEEPDSEFNPGTSFGDDEEDEGPAVLDVKAAKNIARGQSNSMFKIASKIAETQVANTSEIISTINSRTAEMVAATNNINSTLIGISKKLDVIQGYVNARTYAGSDKRKREDSLYDYNGRLTLGSVFEASKQSLANNTALSLASSLKSMSGMGMFTPETVARLIFDWTLGEKQFKALGNQSINQVGSKINDALGQMISDTLEGITRSSGFKKLFGDLHQETRNTNFRSYLKNEYTRNPTVFDGMTRHSIVKIIPEYLKKIHEDLSKESLSINERGELTRGSGKTWTRTMATTLGRGAADYDTISAFTKSSEYSHGVHGNQRAVNTVNKVVTFYYLMYMLNTDQKSLPKEAFDPMSAVSMWVIDQSTTALVNDTTQTPDEWRNVITSFIMYNYTKPGRLNQFRGELTQIYENRAMNSLVNQVNDVSDPQNITFKNLDVLNETAKLIVTSSLPKQQQQTPPLSGNGNVPNIIGNGPGDATAVQYDMFDTLADIRNLLAAEVKFNIGSKRFKSIQLSSINGKPLPVLPENDDSVIFDDDLQEAQKQQAQLSKKEQLGLVKGAIVDTGAAIKDSMQGHKATLQAIVTDEDGNEIPIFTTVKNNQYAQKAFDKAKGFGANAKEWIDNRREQFGVFRNSLGDSIKERAYQKASDRLDDALAYANNLGNSKEDNEDRDTVAMIAAYMNTAIQSGSADQQEKNRIQGLINGLHNQKLKSKLSRSVNSMLDRASWKADVDSNQGKKSGIGKILSMVGLILSPLKLIKTALVAGIPKLIKGIGKVFQKDFEQIRIGFTGLKEGISEYRAARRERRQELKDAQGDQSEKKDSLGDYLSKKIGTAIGKVVSLPLTLAAKGINAYGDFKFSEGNSLAAKAGRKVDQLKENIHEKAVSGKGVIGHVASGLSTVKEGASYVGNKVLSGVSNVGNKLLTGVGTAIGYGQLAKQYVGDKTNKLINKIPGEFGDAVRVSIDNAKERKEQKAADKAEVKAGFKEGLGSFGDFMKNFKESAGIGGGAKMKIDGIEEAAQTFTEKALCKIVSFLTGKDESVLSEQLELEKKQAEEQEGDKNNDTGEGDKIEDPNQENQQNSENNGGSQIVGTLSQQQESGNSEGGGSTGGAVANAVGNAVSNATGEAAEGAAGAVAGAAGGAAGEVAGAVGKLSSLAKIGASLGKIVKSLGTIGMAVLKIVGKAIMMLSGFKTLMKTIDAFKGSIVKIVAAGLKPLNAIFNLVNKVIKPLFATVQNVLKGIMKGVSKILTSVIDVLVPVLNNVLTPVLSALTPVLDVIMNFLEPMFDIISGVINVAIIPAMGIFKFVLVPVIQRIGYAVKTISGLLEIGFGMLMVPLGSILGGIGTLISILPFGSGASGLAEAGFNMADSGRQMIAQGKSDVKEGVASIIDSYVKQFTFQDQSIQEEDTHITNPNAAEIKSVGSVMDGYGSGDSYVNNNSDSHNSIWNISNIYGSGNSQKSYGNALGMSDHGCGPMALADAYSRRTGSSVDGLSMASSMAGSGKYSPTKGTSVGSFMSTSSALGMNLTAGGVTASSLKRATPSNPVTVLGSGSDFGTRSGNNHFMNVIGTDRYGGAYVSNPLTGRVDRRSASTLAGSSVLGLYGSGDTEYYSFPDAVADAISELKGLAGSLLGMFTGKSASDEMSESLEATGNSQNLADVTEQIKKATDEATYNDMVAEAEKLARQDFKNDHPQYKNESDEAYEKRFTKWYTDGMKLKYLEQVGASEIIKENNSKLSDMVNTYSEDYSDPNGGSTLWGSLMDAKSESTDMIASRRDPYSSGGTSSGSAGDLIYADTGAVLYTDEYTPSITGVNITNNGRTAKSESPLHEFFSMMSGKQKDTSTSSVGYWYNQYHNPNTQGVGSSGDHHSGIDVNWTTGSDGKPLYATTGGTVVKVSIAGQNDGGAGNAVKWRDSGGYYHWYMHMRDVPKVKVGDAITGGQLLGYVGNTGYSEGAHLHYSIHSAEPSYGSDFTVNPLTYFKNIKQSAGEGIVGSTNSEKVWNYLRFYGLSPEAAAGIMGNIARESNFGSNVVQGHDSSIGDDAAYTAAINNGQYSKDQFMNDAEGYGLAQWTWPATKGLLYDELHGNSIDISNMRAQMDFLRTNKETSIFEAMKNKSDVKDATIYFHDNYERSADTADMVYNGRVLPAYQYYEMYKDYPIPTSLDDMDSNSGLSISKGSNWFSNIASTVKNTLGISSQKKMTGTAIVNTQSTELNIRKSPGMSAEKIGAAPKGAKVTLMGEPITDDGWVKISYNGTTGYVAYQYLKTTDGADFSISDTSYQEGLNRSRELASAGQANVSRDTMTLDGRSSGGNVLTTNSNNTTDASETQRSLKSLISNTDLGSLNIASSPSSYITGTVSTSGWRSGSTDETTLNRVKLMNDFLGKNQDDESSANKVQKMKLNNAMSSLNGYTVDEDTWSSIAKHTNNMWDALSGSGDSNAEIPDISQSTNNAWQDLLFNTNDADQNSNVTINRITVASNSSEQEQRIERLLNNTYNVRAERVEYLLEQILDKMDNPDKTPTNPSTPSMFTNDDIPKAVHRLSQG